MGAQCGVDDSLCRADLVRVDRGSGLWRTIAASGGWWRADATLDRCDRGGGHHDAVVRSGLGQSFTGVTLFSFRSFHADDL